MKLTRNALRSTGTAVLALAIAAIAALGILGIGSHTALARNGHGMAGPHGKDHAEHFDHVAAALGLSHQQKAAARALHDEASAKAGPLREQARLQHDELEAMLEAGGADAAEVGRRVIAMHATHKQLEAVHAQAMAKFRALLSAQQRTKFEQLHAQHGGSPGKHRHCMGSFGHD